MAAAKCNITFNIDYISSKAIQSATATYKHKLSGATNVFSIVPVPLSGASIHLPEISTPGDYELVVTLTSEDGIDTTKKSSFKIGNCKEKNPPKVDIKWNDGSGIGEKMCNTSNCDSFPILVESSDPENDIIKKEAFISADNGISWSSIISNLSGNTFSTGALSTMGTRLFKVVVTDSTGNTATSNTLSYTKQPGIKNFYRKVINGISCYGRGDGPTNWDVYCSGIEDFSLSNGDLINLTSGFIRLKTSGGTSDIGLSKSGGGTLSINQVLPITTVLTASYGATGYGPYPYAYPANVTNALYRFEYSANGTTNWMEFDLSVDD